MQTSDSPLGSVPVDVLAEQAGRIRASGVLGRSEHIRRLFDFLVECAGQGRVPKEIEIAIDGFGRDARFDASQDALVRVYVHKLRRRLDEYYARPDAAGGPRLSIPRGEYRLVLDATMPAPALRAVPGLSQREWLGVALILLLTGLLVVVGAQWLRDRAAGGTAEVAAARRSAVWAPLLTDDRPIEIVLGDYYIFGERDAGASAPSRLVRDFDVNSRHDLEQRIKQEPHLAARYEDVGLGYLPTASAPALRDLLGVLLAAGKRVHVQLASEAAPALFKSSNVVYIGYLSGLGMLQDVVFAGARFAVGASFDELIDTTTGHPYVSEAGAPLSESERYRDYAYVTAFTGPTGNRHVVIAGTRDTALRQAAEMLVDPKRLAELQAQAQQAADFEALYEVYGVNRTNIEARLLVAAARDAAAIWSEPVATTAAPR